MKRVLCVLLSGVALASCSGSGMEVAQRGIDSINTGVPFAGLGYIENENIHFGISASVIHRLENIWRLIYQNGKKMEYELH